MRARWRPRPRREGLLRWGHWGVIDTQQNGNLVLASSHVFGNEAPGESKLGEWGGEKDPGRPSWVGFAPLSGRIFLLTHFLLAF